MPQDLYLQVEDNSLIRFQRFLPQSPNNKPNILLLQGRGSLIEKCYNTIEQLVKNGFEVWSFDWRGQGLSSREAGRRGYIDHYRTYLKDLRSFIQFFLKNDYNDTPLIVLAHSMGAHIGLRYILEDNNQAINGAVLLSPMLEINTGKYPSSIANYLCKIMCWLGKGKDYVFGHNEFEQMRENFNGNFITRNKQEFYKQKKICMAKPEVTVGGVTFSWVNATINSSNKLLNSLKINKIKIPLQIYAAGNDNIVNNSKLHLFNVLGANCQMDIIEQARHNLLIENMSVQTKIQQGINDFTNKYFAIKNKKIDILKYLKSNNNIYIYENK